MTDVHTKAQRSKNMAAIKSKNTKPELAVRSMLHKLGYRYRLHRQDLPGRPDIVFPAKRKVIFVHGCFWHMHSCRWGAVVPSENEEFWRNKRSATLERDTRNAKALLESGWDSLTVWECEIRQSEALRERLRSFLR